MMRIGSEDLKRFSEFLREIKSVIEKDVKFSKFLPVVSIIETLTSFLLSYAGKGRQDETILRVKTRLEEEIANIYSKRRITLADKYKIYALRRAVEIIDEEMGVESNA